MYLDVRLIVLKAHFQDLEKWVGFEKKRCVLMVLLLCFFMLEKVSSQGTQENVKLGAKKRQTLYNALIDHHFPPSIMVSNDVMKVVEF